MQEWLAQWNWLLPLIIAVTSLAITIWNFFWVRKVRREDQREKLEKKMTELLDKLDTKIVALGREVSEIQGHLGITTRNRS